MDEIQAPSETTASPEDAASEQHSAVLAEPQVNFAGTKHKVKINNREEEIPYEQLIADYRIKAASQERFDEAARMRKEVDAFIGSLKSGDLKQLKSVIPHDQLLRFAEDELREYIRHEEMTDAEKEAFYTKKERDALKAEKDELLRSQQESYMQRINEEAVRELDVEIGQAIRELKAEIGIDPSKPIEPWFVDHVARLMLASLEAGDETAERIPAKVATQKAWKGVENTVTSYLESIPTDKALAMLPRKLRDAVRKADVGEAMTSLHNRSRVPSDNFHSSKKAEKPSTDDFFGHLDKRFGLK